MDLNPSVQPMPIGKFGVSQQNRLGVPGGRTHREGDRQARRQADGDSDKDRDRCRQMQTDADRHTDIQTYIQTYRQTFKRSIQPGGVRDTPRSELSQTRTAFNPRVQRRTGGMQPHAIKRGCVVPRQRTCSWWALRRTFGRRRGWCSTSVTSSGPSIACRIQP